jgi:hypothetical protein
LAGILCFSKHQEVGGGWHHLPTGIEFWHTLSGQDRDTVRTYYFGRQEPGHWLVRCSHPKVRSNFVERLKADGLDNSIKTPIPVRDEYKLRYGSEFTQLGPLEDVGDVPTPWTYELATLYSQFWLLDVGWTYWRRGSPPPNSVFHFQASNVPKQFHQTLANYPNGFPK